MCWAQIFYLFLYFSGSPCEIPFAPVNGDFKCVEDEIGVNCTLRCMDGYDFTAGSNENYHCAYADGIWNPPYSTEWPDCSCKGYYLFCFSGVSCVIHSAILEIRNKKVLYI